MESIVDNGLEREIRRIATGEVCRDEPMDCRTSLGVGGTADIFVVPRSVKELADLVRFLEERSVPFLPVGNCTNLIVRDGGFRGVMISLGNLQGIELRSDPSGAMLLHAEAGVPLARMIELASKEALTGLEFCAGIPGSLGGALRMNAGAWGGEMKDIVQSLFLLAPREGVKEIHKDRLSFSYRNLALPAGHIITAALLSLVPGEAGAIRSRVTEIMDLRRQKHPIAFRSAGSIFKNPSTIPAGKLIEEAGLKGLRRGDALVSELHGNFIVNAGRATAGEVLALIGAIQKRVREDRNIELETEVIIVGEDE